MMAFLIGVYRSRGERDSDKGGAFQQARSARGAAAAAAARLLPSSKTVPPAISWLLPPSIAKPAPETQPRIIQDHPQLSSLARRGGERSTISIARTHVASSYKKSVKDLALLSDASSSPNICQSRAPTMAPDSESTSTTNNNTLAAPDTTSATKLNTPRRSVSFGLDDSVPPASSSLSATNSRTTTPPLAGVDDSTSAPAAPTLRSAMKPSASKYKKLPPAEQYQHADPLLRRLRLVDSAGDPINLRRYFGAEVKCVGFYFSSQWAGQPLKEYHKVSRDLLGTCMNQFRRCRRLLTHPTPSHTHARTQPSALTHGRTCRRSRTLRGGIRTSSR